jgi:hypothetical protein
MNMLMTLSSLGLLVLGMSFFAIVEAIEWDGNIGIMR